MKLTSNSYLLIFLLLGGFFVLINTGCYRKFKERAKGQINELKSDGCIFVRLRTGQNKIDKLKEFGYLKAADTEMKEVEKENQSIIVAFNKYWDFSKFYFFMSDESAKIKNGNFNEVEFIGNNLKSDTSIKCECTDGFVIDLSQTTSNTEEGSNNSGVVLKGLVVKDRNFKQLNYPFPYLSRRYFLIFKRPISMMVRELNLNFHTYFKIANK